MTAKDLSKLLWKRVKKLGGDNAHISIPEFLNYINQIDGLTATYEVYYDDSDSILNMTEKYTSLDKAHANIKAYQFERLHIFNKAGTKWDADTKICSFFSMESKILNFCLFIIQDFYDRGL